MLVSSLLELRPHCAFTIRAIRVAHIQRQTDFKAGLSADLDLSTMMERAEDDLGLEM
jgi:hypothetical protein